MGPFMVLLLLLVASSQLSHAAVQATDTDRIAVQAALQDIMHTDSTHAGRGVTVSTRGVVLREAAAKRFSDPGDAPVPLLEKAARTNDPGDSPVRITSNSIKESAARTNDPGDSPVHLSNQEIKESATRTNDPGDAPVRQSSKAIRESAARTNDPGDSPVRMTSSAVHEAGQARYHPSWSNDATANDLTPDAITPHYVSAPTGNPIYVSKVTYDQPHAAIDDASAAGAAATTVRNMQRNNDPVGRPWGEYNEWLSVTVLNGGQYGDSNAAGGYGASDAVPGNGQVTIQSYSEAQDLDSTVSVAGLDTVGADTVGADPVGADVQGADTHGSGAAAAQRKLRETTVSVAGVNVDVSDLAGKTSVDVAAPFTGVSVREAGLNPAAGPAESAYDELTALLAIDELGAAATPGQYGEPGAAGGYGYGYGEFSIQSYKEPSIASGAAAASGLDTAGADTRGSDTAGADTKGSDTKGSDTAGADTKGSDTVGADTRGSGAAAPERKLLQTTVNVAGVHVDVSSLSGKTAVDVAAPFTGVSVRKETGTAGATAVRALLEAADPAESAYDELTALLAADDLNPAATPGQYGEPGAAGGYGYGYGEFSIQSYKEPAAVSSTGLDTKGADTKGSDTVGADTKGSDTAGADTKGSDTVGTDTKGSTSTDAKGADTAGSDTKGSDPVGADTVGSGAAREASSSISESGQAASGTVGGVYEDPGDFSTQRKLMQTTVSVAGVNVGVSRLASGKTAVDVAAPFSRVSVRKEAAPAPGDGVRKLLRRLLDSAQTVTAADSAKDDEEAEQVEAEHVGDVVDGNIEESHLPLAKTSSSKKSHSSSKKSSSGHKKDDKEYTPPPASGYYSKKSDPKSDEGYSPPPAGGYYSKKSTYKGADVQASGDAAADKASTAADKPAESESKVQTPVQASIFKVDTKGADAAGADTKGADTAGAAAAKPAAAATVAVAAAQPAAAAKPAAVKSFHFATADGEGSEEKPEGASDTPLSMKVAVAAAAAAAVDESKPPAAKGGLQVASVAAATQAATAAKPEAVSSATAAEPAKKTSPSKPSSSQQVKPAATAGTSVGTVQATQEPKAARPMFTKLTLTPKQIEEVKKMRAQIAATGEDEEESQAILPLTVGAESKPAPAITAAAVKTAAIAPANDAKPVHLPGTKDAAVADANAEEDDEDDDDDDDGADDKKATATADDKKTTAKAKVPAKAQSDLKKWADAKDADVDAGTAETAEADLVDEMPKPEDKDAPRDPFFNVVSKPKSPLAGLFGIIRPANVAPWSASPRSPRKAHTRKHGKSSKHHHKGYKDGQDLNPELPHNPYKVSDKHDLPTAAGISSGSADGFKVATAALPAGNSAVASAAKPQEAKAGQPFFFSAKEAGHRAAAAAASGTHIPGSSSSSQDVPIEVVRGARKLLA